MTEVSLQMALAEMFMRLVLSNNIIKVALILAQLFSDLFTIADTLAIQPIIY